MYTSKKIIVPGGHNLDCIGQPETGCRCHLYLFLSVLWEFCNQVSLDLVGMHVITLNEIQVNGKTFSL